MQPWELSSRSERRVKDNRHWPMEITTVECLKKMIMFDELGYVIIVLCWCYCIMNSNPHGTTQVWKLDFECETISNKTGRVQEATMEIRKSFVLVSLIFTASVHCWSSDGDYFVDWCDCYNLCKVQDSLLFLILYSMMYNEGRPTVKWWLVLSIPLFECPKWSLPLVVLPPHAHDHPDMHTSLLSNHPGVGQQQKLT